MTAVPTNDELARFAATMAAQLGLRVEPEYGRDVVERRAALHRAPIDAYLDRIVGDPAEIAALATELTVGETYFLRHIEQFRAFADFVAPDRLANGRLHVLSAGCSSGEEAYTLAMLLRETCPQARFTVHAIDVNPLAIARARAARYTRWSLRATTPAFEQRWFRHDGRDVVVVPEIRAAVTFEVANAVDSHELAISRRWDVVFCRNMVMYFTDAQADALITRIARSLAPGGYLFLGHAETLRGRSDEFSLCHSHGAFYYQRPPITPTGDLASRPLGSDSSPSVTALDPGWYDDIHAATQRVHAMVSVALDREPDAASAAPASTAPASTLAGSTLAGSTLAGSTAPASTPEDAPGLVEIHDLLAQERFAEALDRLDRWRAQRSTPAMEREIAVLRALVLTHSGRFVEARVACSELLTADASGAGASYLMALCCEGAGDAAGAAYMAQRAAELDPSFAMPRVHLGLLARRIGDRAIASRELTCAIELLEREAPMRLALYGGGFSRQTLLAMCRAELTALGAPGAAPGGALGATLGAIR